MLIESYNLLKNQANRILMKKTVVSSEPREVNINYVD